MNETRTKRRDDGLGRTIWLWSGIAGDVRYALRSYRRAPGLTAAIVFTLALGLGSTTAIFSVVNTVLLKPLPYANADRLVQIVENVPAEESISGFATRMSAMSTEDFDWWRKNSQTLSQLAVTVPDNRTFAMVDGTVRLAGALVSPALFAMRGISPVLGRGLAADDERADAGIVVISEVTWRRYFSADPDVLGRTMILEGRVHTIVGVMPAVFGPEAYWAPFVVTPAEAGQFRLLPVTALLRDSVSIEAANAEVNVAGNQLRGVEPDPGARPRFELVREQDQLTARVSPALRVLVAAVAVVLLIVCANVANLLLVRGTRRHEEIKMRRALGATSGRIARQVLTESLLLAVFGGAVGIVLAQGAVTSLKALAAVDLSQRFATGLALEILPRLNEIAIDPAVLAFIAALSLVSAAVFGSLPALRLAGVREAAPQSGAQAPVAVRRAVVGHALAVTQLALAMMLLIGAGLLLHSFVKLAGVDLGFDPRNVLTFELVIPGDYTPERKMQVAEELVARMRNHTQISRIGFTDIPPLSPGISLGGGLLPVGSSPDDVREDASLPPDQRNQQRYDGAEYLRALGVRLRSGRWLDEGQGAPGPAVIVSRAYADHYFPSSSALGATVQTTYGLLPIVGVVDDLHLHALDAKPERIVFVNPRAALTAIRAAAPVWQTAEADRFFLTLGTGSVAFAARTSGDPLANVADIRNAVREMDPALAIDRVLPMEDVVFGAATRPRFYAGLLSVFGSVAALIAIVGIYAVLAYVVGRRTKEIGIRMALGAQRSTVMGLVLGQGAAMIAIGVGAGLAGAIGLARYLEGMLFGLSPLDVTTYAAVVSMFAMVALLASYVPARRATLINPIVALRNE
jgi:putative ABC transport system permease protein